MYTQYNTKGKVVGKIGGGVIDESRLASAVEIQEMKISITNMQNAVSNAANAANKVKEMQVKLNDFLNEQPKVYTSKDVSNSAADVYSTSYVNRELAKIPIITTTNDITGNVSASAVPTVRAIQSIENIGNIPSVMSEYTESSTDTYSTNYMNDLASKIPTPMDVNGISDDINPIVYTANYIDTQLPLICSNYDSVQNSQNVYSTEYVNREFDGVRNEMSTGLNELHSNITDETTEKIESAISELHETIAGETNEAISTANSALQSTISTETTAAISTAISQHETSESPLELKRAKITISSASQETSETVPKFVDNHMRTLNHADTIFCGRILQPNITSATDNITEIIGTIKLCDLSTENLANSFDQSDYFNKCYVQSVKYNDGHYGLRLVNTIYGKDEYGLNTVNVATDEYGNINKIISENYEGYTDISTIITNLIMETQILRAKISQLESALETLQSKHDGSEEIV